MSRVLASNYYRRWLAQVGRQIWAFTVSQVLIGLFLSVVILVCQIHYGLIEASQIRANEYVLLEPYVALILLALGYQVVRAPLALDRERDSTIQETELQLAAVRNELSLTRAAIATNPRSYSERDLATLARLGRDGQQLYDETFRYSPNHPTESQGRLDNWFKQNRVWRTDVLAILNDRDAANFERPATAGSETKAQAGAYNQLHLVARGKLLEDLECIAGILKRYPQ